MRRVLPVLLAAWAAAPAGAASEVVASDPAARQVTALAGTLVWVSGEGPEQRLVRRWADGTTADVTSAPFLRAPDLGRDAAGRFVLTYARCSSAASCTYVRDDLAGERTRFEGLSLPRCAVSSTPAVWGRRVAYGLSCFRRSGGRRGSDGARSGLYVRTGSGEPRRLPAPRNAGRAGALGVDDVDLRGRRVAALYADVYEFAVIQSVGGRDRTSVRAATTEGEGEQSAAGLTVGSGDARMWFLTRSSSSEGPAQAIVNRVRGRCEDWQVLTGTGDDPFDYPYVDLAVAGGTVYAVDPGVGVVTHDYAPQFGCGAPFNGD